MVFHIHVLRSLVVLYAATTTHAADLNSTNSLFSGLANFRGSHKSVALESSFPQTFRTHVPMDDGTLLVTYGIIPHPNEKRPAVLCRSPYGPFTNSLSALFIGLGHVAVEQNKRGTFDSGGTFDMYRHDAGDGKKTLEWIKEQPWSNGEVYTVGISADGMGEIALLIGLEKNTLKGQWWAWTTGNGHKFVYPHGVYRQDLLEGYMDFMSIPTRGASVKNVIGALRQHEAYGTWWQNLTDCRDPSPCYFDRVDFPVVVSAGWWDIFSQPLLDDWHGIRMHSDPSVRDKHVLIVDPLGHCAGGVFDDITVHSGLTKETVAAIAVAGALASEFFVGNLQGSVRSRLGRINLFVMGAFGEASAPNWWTSLDAWPAYHTRTLFFQDGKTLGDLPDNASHVSYLYDPSKPTPMLGGASIPTVCKTKGHCGSSDQLEREGRTDVVVFDTAVLAEDTPVVGRVTVKLFVSSNASDTDFIVTLSDLTPGWFKSSVGQKSMLVRFGAQRMRWRGSDSKYAAPLTKGTVYPVEIDLMTVAYIFPKGHQIRVAVSSAAAPFYNPNFNTGKYAPADHGEDVPLVALNTIHFGSLYPSGVALPVVDKKDIPPNPHFLTIAAEMQAKTDTTFV